MPGYFKEAPQNCGYKFIYVRTSFSNPEKYAETYMQEKEEIKKEEIKKEEIKKEEIKKEEIKKEEIKELDDSYDII